MADWITTEEAAELSGYHIFYLRRVIRSGKIKAEKKGGSWWIDRSSLLEYSKQATTSDDKRHGPKKKQSSS